MAKENDQDALKRVYRKVEEVISRQIVGETILVPIRGNLADMKRIFSLNAVGAFIWEELDGKNTLEEIRDNLLANFDVQEEDADADLNGFISELLGAELIVG